MVFFLSRAIHQQKKSVCDLEVPQSIEVVRKNVSMNRKKWGHDGFDEDRSSRTSRGGGDGNTHSRCKPKTLPGSMYSDREPCQKETSNSKYEANYSAPS